MRRLAFMLAIGLTAACESTPPTTPGPPPATPTLEASSDSVVLLRGRTKQVTLTYTANGTAVDVTNQASWSSSDPNLASVTAGLVSVLKLGEASITATYQGATASIDVVGRRRTGLRGSVTIEDVAGIRSIDGLKALVDGRYVMSRSSSGRQPSMTISFSTADVATALPPGEHTLRLEIDRSGASSGYASAPSSEVVVVDLDTRQDLETLPLSRQDVTLETDGFIEWTVTIPIVSS